MDRLVLASCMCVWVEEVMDWGRLTGGGDIYTFITQ